MSLQASAGSMSYQRTSENAKGATQIMAKTSSTMLALGTPLPPFALPEVGGGVVRSDDFAGKTALLVMFICNHCPYVVLIADELSRLTAEYIAKGVGVVGISANDAQRYPADAPAAMKQEKAARGYKFPYLYDEEQMVAKAFHAACTPEFYVFDRHQRLAYRGQFDSARPGSDAAVTGEDLRLALDAVLLGEEPAADQRPSIGCGIKWRPGQEPQYG